MSDGSVRPVGEQLRILVVGDSRRIETALNALTTAFDAGELVREHTVSDALERLADADAGINSVVHCVVCEFGSDCTSLDDSQLRTLEQRTEVPIIIVTDGADIAAIDRALEVGATDVVNPGDSRALVATRVRNAARQFQLTVGRRASESDDRRSRAVLEQSDALVFVLAADGSITYASPAVESHLGYTASELERTSLKRIVHPDDRERTAEIVTAVSTEPLGSSERAVVRLGDGAHSWRRVELTCVNRLADPELAGIVVTATPTPGATDDTALERGEEPAASKFESGPEQATDTATAIDEHDRRALLESAIDALDDGIAVLEDDVIRLVNGTLVDLTESQTLVGADLEALFDADLAATIRERAQSPVVRWMEPVRGTLQTDGDTIPVDVVVTPLPGEDDWTLCLIRDRRQSPAAALETVGQTVSVLRQAESRPQIYRAVTDAIRACVASELAVWYRLESATLSAAAVARADDQPPAELPPIDREQVNTSRLACESPTAFDGAALESLLEQAGIRAERVLVVPIDERGVVLATSSDPMAFEALDLGPPTALADAAAVALDRLEATTTARDCRRTREHLETSLARERAVRDVERALLEAATRVDVETTLCEGLVSLAGEDGANGSSSDAADDRRTPVAGIDLAWVGRVATGSETISPRTWAGTDGAFLESLTGQVDPRADSPAGRTAATRDSTVIDDLEAVVRDQREPPPPLESALEAGMQSMVSIPIDNGDFQYGTLTAYATQPAAFDDSVRSTCEHLAQVAGYAIGALERKQALLADSVAELEIVVRDDTEPLSAIARGLDSRIDVRSVVPRSGGGSTVYCTVLEPTPDTLRAVADDLEAVAAVRFVGDGPDDGQPTPVEFTITDSTVAETLAEYGGVLRSITPAKSQSRLVIDLSSTVDVRAFVRTIDRAHSGTELLARRERDRSTPSARAFDTELRDRLSERQLRTLEAAYYGGFFDWPRASTGEDVAESLGISQPTFSRHLRVAQRKLFELLFDEPADEQ
ncbi:PAS domain S-box protein [Natronolimnobius sp. AArcel1]|uniref:bacterio-opsin activator domain-containing protein n=1 Tax=Natronolimnobius sp. AArcel1 TaxID=1679093 RepID=UPI0013EC718C|nr:bacterio-opsin activator domain-containing protein [Natronolimnobius sp. AArcel1]NGM71529.1 PAS domain S-box protein [Natronolimnobius sp. AArcel1]